MTRVWTRLSIGFGLAIVATAALATPASAAGTVEGAGSSFPQLEIEQWRSDVAKKPYSLSINYVSSGSTFGRQQYIQRSVDFGVSDIPFQADEKAAADQRPYTYVTISAGGVGFMYNLRDTSGRRIGFSAANGGNGRALKLSARTVCRLFSEPNMMWNDAELVADNPDIALPNNRVQPIFRADGSGTGFVVQEYCIATAPDVWNRFVEYVRRTPVLAQGFAGDPFLDGRPSSKWPVFAGQAAFAGDGVANVVATDTSGANGITYVEAGFAEVRGFPNAFVRNAAGVYHYPESGNVNAALKYARQNDDRTVTLDYTTPDRAAYFPSSYSYAIVPTSGIDASKGKDLADFLNYAVLKGQEKADALGYAPLSREIVEISLNEIVKIPGAPPKPTATSVGVGTVGGGTSGGGTPAVTTTARPATGAAPTTTRATTGAGTGGGNSTGGSTSSGATARSTAGGGTTGGATAGGSTAARSASGGTTAGGATTGGSTAGGANAGRATTGGTAAGGVTAGGTAAGGAAAGGTAAGGAADSGTAAGGSGGVVGSDGVVTEVAGRTVSRAGGGGSLSATVATQSGSAPGNAEVLVTMLQGAALCGAAGAMVYRWHRTKVGA